VAGQGLASCKFLKTVPTIILLIITHNATTMPIDKVARRRRENTTGECISVIKKTWRAKATEKSLAYRSYKQPTS
jgi:hypothetical protein